MHPYLSLSVRLHWSSAVNDSQTVENLSSKHKGTKMVFVTFDTEVNTRNYDNCTEKMAFYLDDRFRFFSFYAFLFCDLGRFQVHEALHHLFPLKSLLLCICVNLSWAISYNSALCQPLIVNSYISTLCQPLVV